MAPRPPTNAKREVELLEIVEEGDPIASRSSSSTSLISFTGLDDSRLPLPDPTSSSSSSLSPGPLSSSRSPVLRLLVVLASIAVVFLLVSLFLKREAERYNRVVNGGRLNAMVVPVHAELDFAVGAAAGGPGGPARGAITHTVVIAQDDVFSIVLHAASSVNLVSVVSEGRPLEFSRVPEYDMVVVELPGAPAKGLTVSFTVAFNLTLGAHGLSGVFNSSFEGGWIVATDLEPAYARTVFPCFDEPAMRVNWTVKLIVEGASVPENVTVLSNMPERARTLQPGSGLVVLFETSPALPSYLVSFSVAVGYEVLRVPDTSPPVAVHARTAVIPQARHLAESAAAAVKFLGSVYPLASAAGLVVPKIDLVVLPTMNDEAMENPGHTTFAEAVVLVDPARTSRADARYSTELAGHEISHYLFGDLVSPRWWSELLLNEGQAQLFSGLFLETAAGGAGPTATFFLNTAIDGMLADPPRGRGALRGAWSRTLPGSPVGPGPLGELFDDVVYKKGASLLRALGHTVGMAAFRAGVDRYLAARRFRTAALPELLAEIELSPGLERERFDACGGVGGLLAQFASRSFPVVLLRSHQGSAVTWRTAGPLNPARDGEPAGDDNASPGPNAVYNFSASFDAGLDVGSGGVVMGTWARGSLAHPVSKKPVVVQPSCAVESSAGTSPYLLFNPDRTAHAVAVYDETLWRCLLRAVPVHLSVTERAGVLLDAYVATYAGSVSPRLVVHEDPSADAWESAVSPVRPLEAIASIGRDTSAVVWGVASRAMRTLLDRLLTQAPNEPLRHKAFAWIRRVVCPVVETADRWFTENAAVGEQAEIAAVLAPFAAEARCPGVAEAAARLMPGWSAPDLLTRLAACSRDLTGVCLREHALMAAPPEDRSGRTLEAALAETSRLWLRKAALHAAAWAATPTTRGKIIALIMDGKLCKEEIGPVVTALLRGGGNDALVHLLGSAEAEPDNNNLEPVLTAMAPFISSEADNLAFQRAFFQISATAASLVKANIQITATLSWLEDARTPLGDYFDRQQR